MKLIFGGGGSGGVERLSCLDFFYSCYFLFIYLFFWLWMQKRLSLLRTLLLTPEDGIPPVRLCFFSSLTSKYDGVRSCLLLPACVRVICAL